MYHAHHGSKLVLVWPPTTENLERLGTSLLTGPESRPLDALQPFTGGATHILRPGELSIDDFKARCEEVTPVIYDIVRRHRGSISAEHGVGVLKKPYLSYSRSDAEIQLMRGIKAVLDPDGVMNPGKIFD